MGRNRQERFSLGGGRSRRRFLFFGTVITAKPEGVFGGESAEHVHTRQQGGDLMEGTSPVSSEEESLSNLAS